jgi:hypothetical protein
MWDIMGRKPIYVKGKMGRLDFRASEELIAWIERWRLEQPGQPSLSQAVRQLLDLARASEDAKRKVKRK